MIIDKIEIGSFGKLDNMTISLSEGVNIIRGGNESGKSTICNFIKFVFYGLPSKYDDKMKLISWNTSSARGAITFKNDDGRIYRVEREVICATGTDGKPLFRERTGIFDATTGAPVFKGMQAGEVFFGVPENVFDSTVYIRQLDGTKVGDRALCESAENILFSGDESINTKRALKKLDDARVYLLHKNKKGGRIFDLQGQSDELGRALEGAQRSGNGIIYLEGTARQLERKRVASEARAAEMKAELENYECYQIKQAYLKYKDELRVQSELSRQIDDLRFAEQFKSAPVYTDEYIARLEKLRSSLEIAEARLDESKKRYEAAKNRVYDMREKIEVFEKFGKKGDRRDRLVTEAQTIHDKVKTISVIRMATLAASAVFAVILMTLMILSAAGLIDNIAPFLIVSTVLVFISLAGFAAALVIGSKPQARLKEICRTFGCKNFAELDELVKAASNDEAVMTYIIDERDAADGAFKSASDALDQINSEILTELEAANFVIEKNTAASIDEALKICREQKRALEALELKKSESDAHTTDIENAFRKYDDDFIKRACTRPYNDEEMEAYDYQARRREYDILQTLIRSQTEKIHETEKELAVLTAQNPRPADIASVKAGVDRELEKLEKEHDAISLALDSMTAASEKLRDGLAPKIAKGASEIMGRLSDGKYKTLGVNSDFGMTFTADTMSHSVDYLSAGTSDIAYISLRIALIDILFRKSVPPFIFDESFMRMDNDRMKNSLALLCDFGKDGTQTLLFTCHGREEKLMKTIGEYTYYTI
ncbi:MAG: AAA family ATPase [Clostridia bacterium]|nr:AAA family ATPase [Clostridia bacterium]